MENSEQLISSLESLPSYESLTQHSDAPAVFADEQEPPIGLIDFIRRYSESEGSSVTTTIKIEPEDMTSSYSVDDQSGSRLSTPRHSIDGLLKQQESYEEVDENLLKNRVKHLFILSENGKPVFTRYGDEDQLVTLMGLMQTLVSFSEVTDSSQLKYIKAGRSRIAFLHKEPLVLVLITHTHEHFICLHQQLNYAYHQIISTLTLSRIKQIFAAKPNFDLRRWLSNAEKKLLHNIMDMYEDDVGMLITSVKCLILPVNIRNHIGQIVVQTIRGQRDMIFGIILAHGHLVSMARLKNYHLHPADLYLLINLVSSSDAFKGVQSWVPVCFPRFDSSGCLHAYISYLDDSCDVCLVLLTVNPEHFQILADFKQTIGEKFNKLNLSSQIQSALEKDHHLLNEINCDELRYFAYKARGLNQYISTKLLVDPYKSTQQRVKLFQSIRYVYGRLHHPDHHLKIVYWTTEHEALVGWSAPGFELYIVFSPLVTLETVVSCIDRILSYIRHEENQLFILRCEYF